MILRLIIAICVILLILGLLGGLYINMTIFIVCIVIAVVLILGNYLIGKNKS